MKRSADALSAGVQKKRQKIRSARTIASENSSQALQDGSLPISQFVAARRFEIVALTEAMKRSREAVNRRAFQTPPRHLRRRAASHNVKRVPKRLRERAKAELAETDQSIKRKGAPYGRKRGRKQTIQRLLRLQKSQEAADTKAIPAPATIPGTEIPATKPVEAGKFMKRQRGKTWLPTHLYASKRAKMKVMWNYAIADATNEKTYRAVHRASLTTGAVIFDTSYQGHVLLKGPIASIAEVLLSITGNKACCGKRAQRGERAVPASIFMNGAFLCPTTILWDSGGTEAVSSVLLSLHPAIYVDVWKLILQEKARSKLTELKVTDMRFQIGSIMAAGPKATDAFISVLKPDGKSDCGKAFRSFHGLQPESIAPNLILPFCIHDPRKIKRSELIVEPAKLKNEYLAHDPKHFGSSGLFSLRAVDDCNKHDGECQAIPVMVYRSELGMTLLAPWDHITHVWHALVHLPGMRWGGQQELAQIYYERQLPSFPTDYPGTPAGDQAALELRKHYEEEHRRRPPAKRLNFTKAINGKPEIGDPFTWDFDYLLNASTDATMSDISHVSVSILDKSSTMDTTADITMEDVSLAVPLYTSTPQVPEVVVDSLPKQSSVSQQKNSAETSTKPKIVPQLYLEQQRLTLTEPELARGLIQVRVTMTKRGNPSSRARIYDTENGNLIGFLTTSNFSLCQGKAAGIGCILVSHVNTFNGKGKQGCYVRDVGQKDFYQAMWQFISDRR